MELLWLLHNQARERLRILLVKVRSRVSRGQILKVRILLLSKNRLSLRKKVLLTRSLLTNRIRYTSLASEAKAEEPSKGLRYLNPKQNSFSNQISKHLSLKF